MSQSKRTVTVACPASNQCKHFETDVKTWDELKNVLGSLYSSGLEAIVNPGRTTLSRGEAELPEGDFQLFLIPTKNKAGVISPSQAQSVGTEIGDAIVKAASLVEEKELNDLRDNLIETIEEFFGVDLDENCDDCKEVLAEARKLMP